MAIQTSSFSTIVSNMVAAIQGAANTLVDLTVGSILRATVEAQAAVALWLQGLALQVAALTRFSTSNGSDADSWAADYGFTRLAAQPAIGPVTFARFTNTAQATIPVGTVVQTADGTQQYRVTADATQSAYNVALGVYVMGVGVSSIVATVTAVTAGAASNAGAGLINTMGVAIAGVDTVTNAAAFTSGANSETDAAFRARFIQYIASLSKATKAAIGAAVTSIKPGTTYTLTENLTYAGTVQLGYFYVVVNDGTGAPNSTFLTSVGNAIDAVRPVGSSFGVFGPVTVTANVALTIATDPAYSHSTVAAQVAAAIAAFINALPMGTGLPLSRLVQVAYDASAGVTNVTGMTINTLTADLAITAQQTASAGTVTVT